MFAGSWRPITTLRAAEEGRAEGNSSTSRGTTSSSSPPTPPPRRRDCSGTAGSSRCFDTCFFSFFKNVIIRTIRISQAPAMLYGGGGRKGEPGNRVSPLYFSLRRKVHWFSHPFLFPFYFAIFSFHNHLFFSLPFSRAPVATKEGRARGDSLVSRGQRGRG